MKKKRRSGNETITSLREKAETEKALREEQLAIRRKQQELEEKKADFLSRLTEIYDGANAPTAAVSDPRGCC